MKKLLLLFLMLISSYAFAGFKYPPLPTAKNVEIARYIGRWYAISSLPQIFTLTCKAQTAEYDIINEKTISVLNTCIKSANRTKSIEGKAVVVNPKTNAELLVTFNNFWTKFFKVKGDYTIIKLSADYEYVMIGSKNRKSLWIMSRTPFIDEDVYLDYVEFAKSLGFKVDFLVRSKF